MSWTEWRLWHRLKHRQLLGHKFRRQVPIGPYFADFACLEGRLAIEVDGESHEWQEAYDIRRDRWFGAHGYRILRFHVAEIREDIDAVVHAICLALGAPPSLPSPRDAGGGRR